MKTYYFGCWDEMKGHYLKDENKKSISFHNNDLPWENFDGELAPKNTNKAGIAKIHHKGNWTALSFWDYSIDQRPGSNSIFFIEGIHGFHHIIEFIKKYFPDIVKRFNFQIIQPNNN